MSSKDWVDCYRNKTILITGATGFVGKAILWHLLKAVGGVIDKVYVLIRPKRIPGGSPSQRLLDEIINTSAFKRLMDKQLLGREKLIPISYDLTLSQLGLSMEESVQMKDTNIVIHCAATSEYESSLEWNLETNVLGTIRLMDYLSTCSNISSFIYLSPIHIHTCIPTENEDTLIKEQVYDLAGLGDPEELLKSLLGADEKELPNYVKRILQKYSTLHLFTKALVEHLIIRKTNVPYSLSIFRSCYIGPSAMEPVPGWTSGISGVSAWLALFSQSIPVIEPDQGQRPVDIVPVDYVSKCIIYSVPQLAHKKETLATIYHIPPLPTSITWYQAYTAIQDYWSRPNNALLLDQKLPTAKNYFSANKTLTKARFLIRYYFRPNAKNTVAASKKLDIDQSKWLELASNIRNNLAKQHTHQWQYDTTHFQQLPLTKYIDMYLGLDEYNYFMQSCYGIKIYSLHGGAHARAPTLDDTSACALYSINKYKTMTPDKKNQYYPEVIDEPFPSIVYTEEEMKQRVKDMMDITIKSLHHLAQSLKEEKVWKPVWIEYINDTLEDWCTMIETLDTDSKNNLAKRWKLTGNAEMTKVAVLNDPNVIEAIQQVSKRSGMPAEKVVEEAIRSLNRIQERTQLPYAWFAASFLEKLLKNMFSCIRINKDDLAKIQKAIGETEKKIIYVPVSRTVLDPIIIWFIAIRYNLPIPVLLLDEALAILGPFSDILRLAGAVFIKRDPHGRSTLTTAVTSAYLRHLLRERGAVTMVLEKVRSRSGLYQKPFDDGMLDMIQDKEDVLFIPVNMTYEEVPDLANLVKHGLHHPKAGKNVSSLSRSRSYRMSTPTKVSRPSDSRAQRVRSRSLGHGQLHLLKLEEDRDKTHVHHYGKILIGFGNPISSDTDNLADKIQKEQKRSAVLSPVSLVAAILLYSRVKGNVIDLETVKKYLDYLYKFIKVQGIPIDWQDFEDSENIIFYSIRLLEKGSDAITIEEKNNHTAIRISIESDSILQLAYYANQLQEIFVLDSIFAVVYLSLGSKGNNDTNVTFFERFEFLATLFQYYFSANWNIKEEYNRLTEKYKQNDKDNINSNQYFNLLASFVYPTIDSFWVTLCALSALLDDVKALPYSLVPLLTQWIGMHLISGRRTIYSEVLSAEYSQNTLKSLFQFGLLDTQSAKMLLSPDAQMLMQILGFSTNENLIVMQEQHDIRQVCKQIEQVRIKLEEGPSSSYVFEKCQNQIKSLIKTKDNTCFSKKQGATLVDAKEEAMIQLGYTLIQSMEPSLSHVSP